MTAATLTRTTSDDPWLLVGGSQAKPQTFLEQSERVSPPTSPDSEHLSRLQIRALCRRLMAGEPGSVQLSECGLPRPAEVGVPGSRLLLEDYGSGFAVAGGQLRCCYSGMRCAYCSARGWARREAELVSWSDEFLSGVCPLVGDRFLLSTVLTLPHELGDSLGVLLEWLGATWSGLRDRGEFVRARGVLRAEPVVVLQVKWGPWFGWHPHLHVTWFCEGPRSAASWFVGVLGEVWGSKAVSVAGSRSVGLRGVRSLAAGRRVGAAGVFGMVVFTTAGHWAYCDPSSRWHPANDHSHVDHKRFWCPDCDGGVGGSGLGGVPSRGFPGRRFGHRRYGDSVDARGSADVFGGVGRAAVGGDVRCQALLVEYLRACRYQHRVKVSSGLRARFGGSPPAAGSGSGRLPGVRPRVWVSKGLYRRVECGLGFRRGGFGDAWGRVSEGDLVGARGVLEGLANAGVDVVEAPDDGCPLFLLADEELEFVMSDVLDGSVNGAGPVDGVVVVSSSGRVPLSERPEVVGRAVPDVLTDVWRRRVAAQVDRFVDDDGLPSGEAVKLFAAWASSERPNSKSDENWVVERRKGLAFKWIVDVVLVPDESGVVDRGLVDGVVDFLVLMELSGEVNGDAQELAQVMADELLRAVGDGFGG